MEWEREKLSVTPRCVVQAQVRVAPFSEVMTGEAECTGAD
jgi:hypothetical protein